MSEGVSLVRREELTAEIAALTRAVNEAFRETLKAVRTSLDLAIEVGEKLDEIAVALPKGGFRAWAQDHFEGGFSTAYHWREIGRNSSEIRGRGIITIREATAVLAELGPRAFTQSLRDRDAEMVRMIAAGISVEEVGAHFNVTTNVVKMATTPGARAKSRATSARAAAKRKRQRLALERQERDRAARRAGGDLSDLYSRIRRLAEDVDSARLAAIEGGVRASLAAMYDELRKAEDALNDAIRERLA